jgi:hypothetical protein
MSLIHPKSQFFISKLKNGALTGMSIPNTNFSVIEFSSGYLHRLGSVEFSFQATYELVCAGDVEILVICNSRNSNLSFQIQVLRSWGLDLTVLDAQ